MLRSLVIAAALAATALPAAAASVTVNIAGLDATAAHAKIEQAAVEACSIELSDESSVTRYYEQEACIAQAVSSAETKLAQSNRTLAKL
jgi:UrcA family protein